MNENIVLKPNEFSNRMGKYAVMTFQLRFFFDEYNLHDRLVAHEIKGVTDLFGELKIFENGLKGIPPEHIETIKEGYTKIENDARENISEYLPILYNEAFVMIVTVFEVFLFDCMGKLTMKHPKLLNQLSDANDLSIAKFLETQSYATIFDDLHERALRRFNYKGIIDKIRVFQKLGVDTDKVMAFAYHSPEVAEKFPNGNELLEKYVNQRHDIVHFDKHVISEYDELEYITTFFTKLALSLAVSLNKQFQMETDYHLLVGQVKNMATAKPT